VCTCGAERIDSAIGLEETPQLYIARLVAVFEDVRRVLKPTGTLWLNIGDAYSGSGKGGSPEPGKQESNRGSSAWSSYGKTGETARRAAVTNVSRRLTAEAGIAGKQLLGIPWRVAFALQDAGWWLRSDIIWAKPNPMPESVTDRPTKSHEYVFMLTKSPRYFFDHDAVREASGANMRTIWTIPVQGSPLPHFAMFPEALVERCIKAGCPAGGVVLDPFAGTGTALKVARDHGRRAVGIELSPDYVELAIRRLRYGVRGALAIDAGQGTLIGSDV
jgi:site-specific DNA-methyltransferase (adenine-specific)